MGSPTQQVLDAAVVRAVIAASLGAGVRVVLAAPLNGGGFAAVWRADLADGRAVVVKVGPGAGVALLGYARDLIAAEAAYFDLVGTQAPGVPVPRVLFWGSDRAVVDGDWLITTLLPGSCLPHWLAAHRGGESAGARRALGAAVAGLGAITAPRFGYSGSRPGGDSWPAAFTAIIESLLDDAARWQVTLPGGPGRVRALVGAAHAVLGEVEVARLVHYDLWEGNVLVTTGGTSTAPVADLCGLVDGERHLYGDALVDLVSPALFHRIEDEAGHPFLAGWAAALGRPTAFTWGEVARLGLYRVRLYLVMLIEMPSRGAAGDVEQHQVLHGLLDAEITYAGAALRR